VTYDTSGREGREAFAIIDPNGRSRKRIGLSPAPRSASTGRADLLKAAGG
jgi:hypothetical protein